jgi:transcriptional regulator with GAF, ATPase, and Fis domain
MIIHISILLKDFHRKVLPKIRHKSVFAAIRDINEVLSLSNETQNLLNMTLDTLARVLGIDCCWVQTIDARKRLLHLAAERGFSSEMRREIAAVDMGHNFGKQIIGLGNSIVIPDLSANGRYGLPSFRAAGYRWLVAAPLMTYRVHGVLGVASRNKKTLRKETADLITLIGGLIGTALNKAGLSRSSPVPKEPEPSPGKGNRPKPMTPKEETPPAVSQDLTEENAEKPAESPFSRHTSKMKAFRRRHR